MAHPLPDCPRCSAASTLEAVDVEPRGVRRCVCSCCASVVRVAATGAIVHEPSQLDVRGNVLRDDP